MTQRNELEYVAQGLSATEQEQFVGMRQSEGLRQTLNQSGQLPPVPVEVVEALSRGQSVVWFPQQLFPRTPGGFCQHPCPGLYPPMACQANQMACQVNQMPLQCVQIPAYPPVTFYHPGLQTVILATPIQIAPSLPTGYPQQHILPSQQMPSPQQAEPKVCEEPRQEQPSVAMSSNENRAAVRPSWSEIVKQ